MVTDLPQKEMPYTDQYIHQSLENTLTLSRPDIFFVSDLALSLEYDRAWQMKHRYVCRFPVKLIIWKKKACCTYNAWSAADI